MTGFRGRTPSPLAPTLTAQSKPVLPHRRRLPSPSPPPTTSTPRQVVDKDDSSRRGASAMLAGPSMAWACAVVLLISLSALVTRLDPSPSSPPPHPLHHPTPTPPTSGQAPGRRDHSRWKRGELEPVSVDGERDDDDGRRRRRGGPREGAGEENEDERRRERRERKRERKAEEKG